MSDIEVRAIREDEMRDYLVSVHTAFHMGSDVSDEQVEFGRTYMSDLSRRLGAFVDGSLCGTAGSFATELTVPGFNTIPMTAVTQVTVLPTHRRRGLLREMMEYQLRDAHARGELAAMLIAAEWPIYGRFGYGMAIEAAMTVVDADAAVFRDPQIRGSFEVVDLPTLRTLAPEPFDRHRLVTPGAISREPIAWDILTGIAPRPGDDPPKKRVRVLHRDPAGTLDGYVVYETSGDWVHNRPKLKVDVLEMIANNNDATVDLWRYLCAIDWVSEIQAHARAVDEDVRQLFADGRVAHQAHRSDRMWVRLIDVPAALGGAAIRRARVDRARRARRPLWGRTLPSRGRPRSGDLCFDRRDGRRGARRRCARCRLPRRWPTPPVRPHWNHRRAHRRRGGRPRPLDAHRPLPVGNHRFLTSSLDPKRVDLDADSPSRTGRCREGVAQGAVILRSKQPTILHRAEHVDPQW